MMLYSTHTWDLKQALDSASPASCKTPAISIDSISPNNHSRRNKKFLEKDQTPNMSTSCIEFPWPMYTEPRATRDRLGTKP